jgi:CRP-like cAMP-binding protein
MLRHLSDAELETLAMRATITRCDRGDTLLRRGDPATGMMVILQGRVRISITSADGREVSLGMLGPGNVVGEMALLDGGERSADVIATEDCVLLLIARSDFLPLLEGSPSLCLKMLEVLCSRLRDVNRSMEEIATLSLPERLGRILLRLARTCGGTASDELRLELRLSQKDLSTLVGASREKVNRQLRLWEQTGALMYERGYMHIRKPGVLAGDMEPDRHAVDFARLD